MVFVTPRERKICSSSLVSDLLHDGERKESKKQEIRIWSEVEIQKKATNNVFAYFKFSSLSLDLFCENKKNVRTVADCTFIVKNKCIPLFLDTCAILCIVSTTHMYSLIIYLLGLYK